MKRIAVIGAGAAGLTAAITAASNGAEVVILEHMDRAGKKILSTGNGRCNFTNTYQTPSCYHSENEGFPWKIIEKFNSEHIIDFFSDLGVYAKERNGYMYPNSDQASAVLDALRMEAERLKINLMLQTECLEISPGKKEFTIHIIQNGKKGKICADSVIICTGSKAFPSSGSDGSGYDLAKKLGHSLIPVLPALVQLRCDGNFFRSIAGVRVQGTVSIWSENQCLAKDTGELQLTNYGISGIPVFQVSRYASIALYKKKSVSAVLDFMPEFSDRELKTFLMKRAEIRPQKQADQFFVGLFNKKLADLWLKEGKFPKEKKAGTFTEKEIEQIVQLIKNFKVTVTGTNAYEQAQVCRGGIDTREVHPDTLESIYIPGLYFAGEILDVDGMCGGYNLTWAWASGAVSGKEAAESRNNFSRKRQEVKRH